MQDSHPFRSALYQAGPKTREPEEVEIQKHLNADVTEPATTEWALPLLFFSKKDKSFRFFIGYRRLNEATIKDTYYVSLTVASFKELYFLSCIDGIVFLAFY